MKTFVKIMTAVLLVTVLVVSLVSCTSKYGDIRAAFEKEGYSENQSLESTSKAIKEELEKKDFAVEIHLLTKSNKITSALVVEFKSTQEMVEAYESSATIRDLVKDIADSEDVNAVYNALTDAGYAKGNCLVIPLSLIYVNEITNIVKSA